MNMNPTNINQTGGQNQIEGICCDVTNCHYNKNDHNCTAKEVKVGPAFAASSADTICSTFKPKA